MVERIINKVIKDNIDIDRILIVTFTNAAASEMRERILDAIYKKMEEEPENENLQRQIVLLNRANISTIHSFCLDVIRNNFYEIDTSANFRVADDAEVDLIKQETIDEIFEEKYISQDKKFEELLNMYTNYRGDEKLAEIILSIYKFVQSSPFPEKWLEEQVEKFNLKENLQSDFSETVWGKVLLDNYRDIIEDAILKLRQIENKLAKYEELEKCRLIICQDIELLNNLKENAFLWDTAVEMSKTKWATWSSPKNVTLELKEEAKVTRTKIKAGVLDFAKKYLNYKSEQANADINEMYEPLKSLNELLGEFTERFTQKKKEKNIVDFNDIEHFALKILLKQGEDGNFYETDVAQKYKEKFEEIAVDEYQDSNLVQDKILSSVSRGNNIFMVGDVKQSIYKFRQAKPELFLEKYDKYSLKNQAEDDALGIKIQLFRNFRSRENVLNITNLIFENIMSKELGNILYSKEEFLNYGADYPKLEESLEKSGELLPLQTDLDIIDLKEPEPDIYKDSEEENKHNEDDETELDENIEDIVLEAKYVASKIKKIVESEYKVYEKNKGYRNIKYKDIVVLLRSTKVPSPIFEQEISNLNIPVFSDVSSKFLETMEIQTIISLLKIIDNPLQDIPLATVMRSSIGNFTDNELVVIRGKNKKIPFYESVKNKYDELCNECEENTRTEANRKLKEKIELFLTNLEKWQDEEKYIPLDELIWKIYNDTNFYNYVTLLPNGGMRQANLKLLFDYAKNYESASFKGLFNFINFIDRVHSGNGEMSSAKLIGENENVVRIMSIHKSKGLEFPVVFLAGMGKQFNFKDLNDNIVLHQELGFGPTYINAESKLQFNTLAKEAIRLQAKTETLSEEMRVLYVALTRAKEKLIITATVKDVEKAFKEKEEIIQMYQKENSKGINYILLKRYRTFLDWIELVYFSNREKAEELIKLNVLKKSDLLKQFGELEVSDTDENSIKHLNAMADNIEQENLQSLESRLKWNYKYETSITIPTKTSVTKIKEMENEEEKIVAIDEIVLKEEESNSIPTKDKKPILARPQFLNEEVKLTNAQKGTLMHLCFQRLDESKEYTMEMLKDMVEDFVNRKLITRLEADSINMYKLLSYTKSELFYNLRNAREVHKEQPFYISLTADEIYSNGTQDNILVQGIIDLYYVDSAGRIVLVDYKTDFVQNNMESTLVDKYSKQLEIYKRAIQLATGKNVDKCYLYSVYLEKLVEVHI